MAAQEVSECILRVVEKRNVAAGVVALTLADPDGGELPTWTPGAHIDLFAPNGMVRQYSLCGDVDDALRWRVAVLREPNGRGGSASVHDQLQAQDLVTVRGPRNHFAFVPAPRCLFIAGGIGITPLLPMIAAAEAAGCDWQLHYGGRTRTSMAFANELVSRHGDTVRLHPMDEVGLLDLPALLGTSRTDTTIYCCGPEPLLAAVETHSAHWPHGALHVERFRPRVIETPAVDTAFEVDLARSGLRLTVPADETILQTVRNAGVAVPSSCEEGTCGTCETDVLAGIPDHRDSLLTDDERASNQTILLCVSRCQGASLVLDL